jgi:hypothetical protein
MKVVALSSIVLFAVAAFVATEVSAAAPEAPKVAHPSPAPAVGPLTPTFLFKALAEGAAKQTGGQFAGWALGAIGLGGSDTADLAKISGQLQAISDQLAGIQATLDGIQRSIEAQTCNQQLNQAAQAVVAIKTADTNYRVLVALGTRSVVDVPRMQKFADQVLDGTGLSMTIKSALITIETAMTGPAGTGILRSCLVPSIVPPPAGGETNYFGTDVGYYGYDHFGGEQSTGQPTVNSFVGYYYGYQALGLMLLQEADRFEAQQSVGETNLTPEDVGELCDLKKYPAAAGDCVDAEIWTNDVYKNLLPQFEYAGLPYTDEKVMWNARNNALFVRSLEDFTRVKTPGCHDPLTTAHPCGVTVATWDTAADAMDVPYDGYGTWHTVTSDQVADMIGDPGSLTPGQYMDKVGFEHAEHKIILTSTRAAFKTPSSAPRPPSYPGYPSIHGTMACFFDTDVKGSQFCGEHDVSNRLLELAGNCSGYARGWLTNRSLPIHQNNNHFFAAEACGTSWKAQPGWLVGNTGDNTRQYRWPRLMTAKLECTGGRSHTNAEGVPTTCGANFAALFDSIVPRPTTCPGTTVGECSGHAVRSVTRSLRTLRLVEGR